ncbi:hypothetical protein [Seinonella peptonophila]|uniref:hypothetical protein n=1 Tax=Seinonella peptonophila TaxID=112248 RepID=UPI0009343B89|nr:hypothetical protein [Seinonella peptonophila]
MGRIRRILNFFRRHRSIILFELGMVAVGLVTYTVVDMLVPTKIHLDEPFSTIKDCIIGMIIGSGVGVPIGFYNREQRRKKIESRRAIRFPR